MRYLLSTVPLAILLSLAQSGCSVIQPAPTPEGRIQQAADIRATFELYKADKEVLCSRQALPQSTCDSLQASIDIIEPVVQQLEAEAPNPAPADFNYRKLFYDLQPRILAFIIDISRHKAAQAQSSSAAAPGRGNIPLAPQPEPRLIRQNA